MVLPFVKAGNQVNVVRDAGQVALREGDHAAKKIIPDLFQNPREPFCPMDRHGASGLPSALTCFLVGNELGCSACRPGGIHAPPARRLRRNSGKMGKVSQILGCGQRRMCMSAFRPRKVPFPLRRLP